MKRPKNLRTVLPKVQRNEYHVISDGHPLFVREICPGNPSKKGYVLFVHGLTFPSIVDFDLPINDCSLTEYLANRGINCCIFDLRGYGKSFKPPYGEPIGMAERARDLSAVYQSLMRKHDTKQISLAGLSSGCNTITEFLETSSVSPHSAVFIAPCYLLNPAMMTVLRRAQIIRFLQSLFGRSGNVYASLGKYLLRNRLYQGEEELIDRETFETFVQLAIEITSKGRSRLSAPVLSYPETRPARKKWDPLFNARILSYPLLILRGDRDEFCCQRSAESLARDVTTKEIEIVTFDNRKHDIHLYKQHLDFFETVFKFFKLSF